VGHIGEEKRMSKLRLTFACGPYDRTLALRDGSIQPEGIELNYIASQPPDIFWRMLQFKEFEISEMSLSNHATLVSTGELPFIDELLSSASHVLSEVSRHVGFAIAPANAEAIKAAAEDPKVERILVNAAIKNADIEAETEGEHVHIHGRSCVALDVVLVERAEQPGIDHRARRRTSRSRSPAAHGRGRAAAGRRG
jgi:hypothetical protein